jgi:hypothetical protein
MPPRSKKRATPAPAPTPEEEAAAYLRGLARRGKIAACDKEPMPAGTTHVLEVRGSVKRVRRKRFS